MTDFWNNIKFFLVGAFPNGEFGGLVINLFIAVLTMATGFIVGIFMALGRISENLILKKVCTFIIETIRAMPLVLIVFWFYFIIPLFMGRTAPLLLSAYLSISLYSAVNQAEIFRTGFLNINKGQWQIAECTGMSYSQCIIYIILPQTLKMMLPSLVGFFISLFKDTSVITIIGIIDLTHVGLMISQRDPSKLVPSYLIMGVIYFVFCFALSRIEKRMERKQQEKLKG